MGGETQPDGLDLEGTRRKILLGLGLHLPAILLALVSASIRMLFGRRGRSFVGPLLFERHVTRRTGHRTTVMSLQHLLLLLIRIANVARRLGRRLHFHRRDYGTDRVVADVVAAVPALHHIGNAFDGAQIQTLEAALKHDTPVAILVRQHRKSWLNVGPARS